MKVFMSLKSVREILPFNFESPFAVCALLTTYRNCLESRNKLREQFTLFCFKRSLKHVQKRLVFYLSISLFDFLNVEMDEILNPDLVHAFVCNLLVLQNQDFYI